jgi:hypothetical protein
MDTRQPWDQKSWEDFVARVGTLLQSGDVADVTRNEFSPAFVLLALGAMQVSYYKYGAVREGYPHRVNAIGTADSVPPGSLNAMGSFGKRLEWYFRGATNADGEQYIAPGNVEYLVDAANFLMIEFMCPAHPLAHYEATDRDGSPGRMLRNAMYDRAEQIKNADIEPGTMNPFTQGA